MCDQQGSRLNSWRQLPHIPETSYRTLWAGLISLSLCADEICLTFMAMCFVLLFWISVSSKGTYVKYQEPDTGEYSLTTTAHSRQASSGQETWKLWCYLQSLWDYTCSSFWGRNWLNDRLLPTAQPVHWVLRRKQKILLYRRQQFLLPGCKWYSAKGGQACAFCTLSVTAP